MGDFRNHFLTLKSGQETKDLSSGRTQKGMEACFENLLQCCYFLFRYILNFVSGTSELYE